MQVLTGEAAERNRRRLLTAIQGENEVAGGGARPVLGANPTEKQLLDALDAMYPTWLERVTGVPGAKRARLA